MPASTGRRHDGRRVWARRRRRRRRDEDGLKGAVGVLDVGEEAQRRRRPRFEVSHARLAEEELTRERLAGSRHPQRPGQPLTDDASNLVYVKRR